MKIEALDSTNTILLMHSHLKNVFVQPFWSGQRAYSARVLFAGFCNPRHARMARSHMDFERKGLLGRKALQVLAGGFGFLELVKPTQDRCGNQMA